MCRGSIPAFLSGCLTVERVMCDLWALPVLVVMVLMVVAVLECGDDDDLSLW